MANELLAVIFSFFLPGLGQLYAGRFLRGIVVFILFFILVIALYVMNASYLAFTTLLAFALALLIIWVWNLVDAYMIATKGSPFLIKVP